MICPTVRIKSDIHPDGVVINESDFNDEVHELHGVAKKMSVAELKAALTEKGIDIPEGAKKPDLQALLDANG